jgi:type I restriction enzyme S subunit
MKYSVFPEYESSGVVGYELKTLDGFLKVGVFEMSTVVADLVRELPKSKLPAGSAVDDGEFVFFVSGPKPLLCDVAIQDGEALVLSTGGNAAVHIGRKQFSYSTDCWALEPIASKVYGEFLYQYIRFKIDHIDTFGFEGSGLRHLKKEFIRKYSVPEFTKPEQTKIAEVLSTVDRAIEQTEALIAKQQHIKTGLMQDLLTRGIDEHGNLRSEQTHKFKDSTLGRIPVEWEVRTLDRLTKAIVDCPHTTPQFTQGGILVARTFNIKEGQFLGEQSYISNEEYKERILRLEPQKGDVIFTREAPVGEAFLIPVNFKVCLGQRTMLLRCVLNECLPEYLVEVIYSEDMRIRFDQKVGGTTNPHLNVGDVRSLAIKQPPIKEQLKITALLVEIRKTLNCYDQEKSKLCSIKTALMQDLLTGKKRVTPLLTEPQEAGA